MDRSIDNTGKGMASQIDLFCNAVFLAKAEDLLLL
jgi:hypothetical protein